MFSRRSFLLSLAAPGPKYQFGIHCWVWASKLPNYDPFPAIDAIFSDCSAAGASGVELMHRAFLAHDDGAARVREAAKKHSLPCWGSSFSANMWDAAQKSQILKDAARLCQALETFGAKVLGLSVGDAKRLKTAAELDAQATCLREIFRIASDHGIEPNLHNHTYEVRDNEHDLAGTLARLPDARLGPDFNWLLRGGVDPVDFIHRHGSRIVYAHLRNQDAAGRWTEDLATGAMDYAAIARALAEANAPLRRMSVELAFERDFTPTRPIRDSIRLSIAHAARSFRA
jgi:sugar phosphate isomerase/epimerase